MLSKIFKRNKKTPDYIFDSLPVNLKVYEDISFKIKSTDSKIDQSMASTNDRIIHFKLSGELDGHIVCVYQSLGGNSQFEPVLIEGLNILLGQFLTRLDKNANLMCMIDSPKEITGKQLSYLSACEFSLVSRSIYHAFSKIGKLPIKMYIHANKENVRKA